MRFIARQPIFDRQQQVFGYELLFRSGMTGAYDASDAEQAACSTLDTSVMMGLDVLCHGTRAFLNFGRDVLLSGYPAFLPPQQTVIEILETVTPDDEVIAACRNLKKQGYTIALDDFISAEGMEPLIQVADIIKVDIRQVAPEKWASLASVHSNRGIRMLAEKVETREEFERLLVCGYHYFQGYFLSRPATVAQSEIPPMQANYLRLLQLVQAPQLDFAELERSVKREAALCYRLLRYLNSSAFGFTKDVTSIRHALSLLGENEVRRWMCLVALVGAGQGRPPELVRAALVRARFCELLAGKLKKSSQNLFLLGLLSAMDVLLELPLEIILERMPVSKSIKDALLDRPSPLGPVYKLERAYEAGNWDACQAEVDELRIGESEVAASYIEAAGWAAELQSKTA